MDLSRFPTQDTEPEGMLEDYSDVPEPILRYARRVYALMGKEAAIGIQEQGGAHPNERYYAVWRFQVQHGKREFKRLLETPCHRGPVDILPAGVVEPGP